MEPAPAREGEDRPGDETAGPADLRLHRFQVMGVEDDQGRGGLFRRIRAEAGVQPPGDRGVGLPEVGEGPAEGLAVEPAERRQVPRGELDVSSSEWSPKAG